MGENMIECYILRLCPACHTHQLVELHKGDKDAGSDVGKELLSFRVRHPRHRRVQVLPTIPREERGQVASLGGQHALQDAWALELPKLDVGRHL